MARKKEKSATEIIYQIKDLLDDLELKVNPDEGYVSEEEDLDDEEFDLDDDSEEE